mmetsp:Transcript_39232/g.121267  ORF Transcript_39232/g.121267 Transcript_39232/m.121267 type:complete len:328 (-) Transcript_39232:370-1353(-)
MRRRAASSSSSGRFVAPTMRMRSLVLLPTPSKCTRNSVLTRRTASCSPSLRIDSSESISSMKMTVGCFTTATANMQRTIFSPSPIHLDMSDDDDTFMKVHEPRPAMARAIIVFPVPGGPKRSRPRVGSRMPEKRSGRASGHTIASSTSALACSRPATSSQDTSTRVSRISDAIWHTSLGSSFASSAGTVPSGLSSDSGNLDAGSSSSLSGLLPPGCAGCLRPPPPAPAPAPATARVTSSIWTRPFDSGARGASPWRGNRGAGAAARPLFTSSWNACWADLKPPPGGSAARTYCPGPRASIVGAAGTGTEADTAAEAFADDIGCGDVG